VSIVHGKKTDIDAVRKFAQNLDGQLLSTVYVNMLTKMDWQCKLGHIFTTTFNHVKNRNQWCPICGREKANKSLIARMATLEAREKISRSHWIRNGKLTEDERVAKKKLNKKNRFLFRLKTESQQRLKHNIRQRVRMALEGVKSNSVTQSLGCTWEELRIYLQSKFQPGMSWENYGLYGWHVDHIIPICNFNLDCPEEFKKACHYTNLQPLWAKDNLVKSNKI
jgi:uncharacterized Zn finger protein (UPF0148 family)